MDYLSKLENQSIYILREAFNKFENLAMLWSIGKDSTVLLWLARKAFFGHVPFPLVHVDTSYKIPSMIAYRDRLCQEWNLQLVVGKNEKALKAGITYPNGKATRVECCGTLTEKLDRSSKRFDDLEQLGLECASRRGPRAEALARECANGCIEQSGESLHVERGNHGSARVCAGSVSPSIEQRPEVALLILGYGVGL